jgi:uncharacterized repeat protein (TIGR04138 family)
MSDLMKLAKGRPYRLPAYEFVLHALNHTLMSLKETRHITGAELAEGIRVYALQELGPMAKHVLNSWGVTTTRDFGEIVFDLVEAGHLRKTEDDRIEDFEDCYDFATVFERDYFDDRRALDD